MVLAVTRAMHVDAIDHLVMTCADVDATVRFYTRALGMAVIRFGEGRLALGFGAQKINLHPAAAPIRPHARVPQPGTVDLCLLTTVPIDAVQAHLQAEGITIESGPVRRTGARGSILSLYLRDPDGNLVEVSNPIAAEP